MVGRIVYMLFVGYLLMLCNYKLNNLIFSYIKILIFYFYSNYIKYWYIFWDFCFGNCFIFNGGISDFGES